MEMEIEMNNPEKENEINTTEKESAVNEVVSSNKPKSESDGNKIPTTFVTPKKKSKSPKPLSKKRKSHIATLRYLGIEVNGSGVISTTKNKSPSKSTTKSSTKKVQSSNNTISTPIASKDSSSKPKKNGPSTVKKTAAEKRAELIKRIAELEEKEKKEKNTLMNLRTKKTRLEKQGADGRTIFPIDDELLSSMKHLNGNPLIPLPPTFIKLDFPENECSDLLFVWDFLHTFNKELSLKMMSVDDFIQLLNYTEDTSPALVEIFCVLIRFLLRDHDITQHISNDIPSHINFASTESVSPSTSNVINDVTIDVIESDWLYNGLKLLPKKLKSDYVDGLRWQSLLRVILPRLPSYKNLLRAINVNYDTLQSIENKEGLYNDGYVTFNYDNKYNITSNIKYNINEITLLKNILNKLESNELYILTNIEKLKLLKYLCLSCYDIQLLREKLMKHIEIRNEKYLEMQQYAKDEKKKLVNVSSELKEIAINLCRDINKKKNKSDDGDVNNKSIEKGKIKNKFDPTPQQLNSMIEDLLLRKSLDIDVLLETLPPIKDDSESDDEYDDETRYRKQTRHATKKDTTSKNNKEKLTKKEKEQMLFIRDDAVQYLVDIADNNGATEKQIRDAIKYALQGGHRGVLPDGNKYCSEVLFKVYKVQAANEQVAKDNKLNREHEKVLAEYFVRTEPLGKDRHMREYWSFDGDNRLFVETRILIPPTPVPNRSALQSPKSPKSLTPSKSNGNSEMEIKYRNLCACPPGSYVSKWEIYASVSEITALIDALDERGKREKELKAKLCAHYGLSSTPDADKVIYSYSGSEYIGRKVKRVFGKKHFIGVIVGWLPPEKDDAPLWHVVHPDGDDEDLDLQEVLSCLVEKDADSQVKDTTSTSKSAEFTSPSKVIEAKTETVEDDEIRDSEGEDDTDKKQTRKRVLRVSDGNNKKKRASGDNDSEESWDEKEDAGSVPPDIILKYYNNVIGGFHLHANDVGIIGLRNNIIKYFNMLTDSLKKSPNNTYYKENKRNVDLSLKVASSIYELKSILLEIELMIHGTQSVEDELDGDDIEYKRNNMKSEGWIFEGSDLTNANEELKHHLSFLGKKCRKFFQGHGKSDGTIIAYLPKEYNEGIALWHMAHDDGDSEDFDYNDVQTTIKYYDLNIQENDDMIEYSTCDVSDNEDDKKNSDDDSEQESDEGDFNNDEHEQTLWPSLNVRRKWLEATNACNTVSELALALGALMDAAKSFGVLSPDPLESLGNRSMWSTKNGLGSSTKRRRSIGVQLKSNRGAGKKRTMSKSNKASIVEKRILGDRAAKKIMTMGSYADY